MAVMAPLILRSNGPITFCSVLFTVARIPLTALSPLEMMLIKPVKKPSCAFAGCGTNRARITSSAIICIRRLATNFQLRPNRPKNKARLAGISLCLLSIQLCRLRARLPREGGASLDYHGVVPEARSLQAERTRDHLLDMRVAFKRGNVCRRCTVGSGSWRDHKSLALNGSRRRDCLIGARVGQLEHHQVVDGHRVIDIHQVPFLGMRVCHGGNGSISLDESGPERGQVSGTPVPHDRFELARVGKLGATYIDAVQSVERARELSDELLNEPSNPVDFGDWPNNLFKEVPQGAQNILNRRRSGADALKDRPHYVVDEVL